MLLKRWAGTFVVALLLVVSMVACEVEIGGCGVSVGDRPNFSIMMYQGQDAVGGATVTLEQVQDLGPLVVYYFDAQCEGCVEGLRVLQNFYTENQDRPTVLAVYVGHLTGAGDGEDAKRLLAEAGATFPAGFTSDDFVIEEYGLELLPITSFFKSRNDRTTIAGGLPESALRDHVEEILD